LGSRSLAERAAIGVTVHRLERGPDIHAMRWRPIPTTVIAGVPTNGDLLLAVLIT
jgi:hypothetical protein